MTVEVKRELRPTTDPNLMVEGGNSVLDRGDEDGMDLDEDEGDGEAYLIPQLAHQQSSPKVSPVKVIEDLNRK